MIGWQFACFKYAHFHGGQIKPNKLIVILHLLDMCNLYSKLYYILVFFNQLYLIVCKHGHNLWQQFIENSFPGFSKQAGSFLFSKSIVQLNKSLILWSNLQLWLLSEGNIHLENTGVWVGHSGAVWRGPDFNCPDKTVVLGCAIP